MLKNWKLGAKTLVPTVAVAICAVIILAVIVQSLQKKIAVEQAKRTAAAISRQVKAERKIYTDSVVSKLKKDGVTISPTDLKTFKEVQGGIPLPASFVHATSELVNASGQHNVDLLSKWNINPSKGARSKAEEDAMNFLIQNQNDSVDYIINEGTDSARYVQVTADIASVDSCVTCHNSHPGSPKRDFALGDTMGALVVSLPMGPEFRAVEQNTYIVTFASLGAIILVTICVLLFQYLFVNKPLATAISELEAAAERVSSGDIDEPVKGGGTDEIGQLSKAFERMRVSLKAAMDQLEEKGS